MEYQYHYQHRGVSLRPAPKTPPAPPKCPFQSPPRLIAFCSDGYLLRDSIWEQPQSRWVESGVFF